MSSEAMTVMLDMLVRVILTTAITTATQCVVVAVFSAPFVVGYYVARKKR